MKVYEKPQAVIVEIRPDEKLADIRSMNYKKGYEYEVNTHWKKDETYTQGDSWLDVYEITSNGWGKKERYHFKSGSLVSSVLAEIRKILGNLGRI